MLDGGVVPDAAVLAFGTIAFGALDASGSLLAAGDVAVWDARFAKPVDTALIRRLVELRVPIVTVEDHGVTGGFGSAVLEAASAMGLDTSGITRLGLPDAWVYQGSRAGQLAEVGLDAAGIARATASVMAARPRDVSSMKSTRA